MLGGALVGCTRDVALVYGLGGALVFLLGLAFSFTPLGRAGCYPPTADAAP